MLIRIHLGLLFTLAAGLSIGAHQDRLAVDRGAVGTWQAIQKLQTFASVLHTTAHPDDEHGAVLTWLSRGLGTRVSLLTLTRGEAGDNAIGPELFDALGLIRTEELRAANRHYGVDRQYFTSMVDYGFSKRVEEAWSKWDRVELLREVVHVIRAERPLVVVSRFLGTARDGHGNHVAAGAITREAFEAAGDSTRFPEQLAAGLRPWRARKLYVGGLRPDEPATVEVDVTTYSPWLGMSYRRLARLGLSMQRSQTAGRSSATPGAARYRYERVWPDSGVAVTEADFFAGIETGWDAALEIAGSPGSEVLAGRLGQIGQHVTAAADAFSMRQPSASVPSLVQGLRGTREVLEGSRADSGLTALLRVKEDQFELAISMALGLQLEAVAGAPGAESQTAIEVDSVVPGQRVAVDVSLTGARVSRLGQAELAVEAPRIWRVEAGRDAALTGDGRLTRRVHVTIGDSAQLARPPFARASLVENRYTVEPSAAHAPFRAPVMRAVARYTLDGVEVTLEEAVRRREALPPYGYALRELQVLPALGVSVAPRVAVVPRAGRDVELVVDVQSNGDRLRQGSLKLDVPAGWDVRPAVVDLGANRTQTSFRFSVRPPDVLPGRDAVVTAVATAGGADYSEGYQVVAHRDLETRYLFRPARSVIRPMDVAVAENLNVGYVMGIGDDIPAAIRQLGASVRLLGEGDLAVGNLGAFDALVLGTRAYAVRADLLQHNGRLLEYAEAGGNLIVLYNTQEFVPTRHAPFDGELPRRSEEVSEENAPIEFLAGEHPVLTWPNRIDARDFDGWVEQRGSKFLSQWVPAYTPIIASHDTGQSSQAGGWLTAEYGRGHYTYFAYALHRQLPFGVPGAFRILANLLSMGRYPAGGAD